MVFLLTFGSDQFLKYLYTLIVSHEILPIYTKKEWHIYCLAHVAFLDHFLIFYTVAIKC